MQKQRGQQLVDHELTGIGVFFQPSDYTWTL